MTSSETKRQDLGVGHFRKPYRSWLWGTSLDRMQGCCLFTRIATFDVEAAVIGNKLRHM